MPTSADPAQRPPQLVLANGLRVRLLPLPASAQSAALIRVHAGSHDAPTDFPGLAHFLEHLLFLGSRDYPASESLMPFVQGCGGQLNASTRERHTDFFFQLPAGHLKGALLRLLDMLTHPLLDPDAQLREREVLNAEFHARAQDAETLCDAALGQAIEEHPFSGFHAGNRDTLPVEQPAFQQALIGYHRCFYQAGQVELLLAGPQAPELLLQLAEQADATLPPGTCVSRQVPPLLGRRAEWIRLHLEHGQPRLLVGFVLDGLLAHSATALDYLGLWLESEASGGLAQRLRESGLCRSVKLRTPYWHEGQGVAVIELLPTEKGLNGRATLVDAVLDWLRFFSDGTYWQPCFDEYQLIRRRGLQGAEPLAQLRHWVTPLAWGADSEDVAIQQALASLMGQMLDSVPLILTADVTDCDLIDTKGFPLRLAFKPPQQSQPVDWKWQQPARNPWLGLTVARHEAREIPTELRWIGPRDRDGQGALFLRWQFVKCPPSAGLWHTLAHAIQPSVWAAQQAGVSLRFEDVGSTWHLRLEGFAEAIPTILSDTMAVFVSPSVVSFDDGKRHAIDHSALRGDEMLLRQLLDRLPQLLASGAGGEDVTVQPGSVELARLWRTAHWQGLAVGFAEDMSGPLADTLRRLPGDPSCAIAAARCTEHKRWHWVGGETSASEAALLLFCPLPNPTSECEAAWRVLAQLIEGPFFRRLRSELQLGYAVFSRFSQFGSHTGIVFGVQSPTASAARILEHVQAFLTTFSGVLADKSVEFYEQTAGEAASRHVADETDLRARAGQAWQSFLSGNEPDHPVQVAAAIRALKPEHLTAALDALRRATGGWVAVANAPAPDASWS
jgi:coenzyme PQQ biosynthesis probable peptidase PqqF